jgi:hypothetical protein
MANSIKARMATEEDWNRSMNDRPPYLNTTPARKYIEHAKDIIPAHSEIKK